MRLSCFHYLSLWNTVCCAIQRSGSDNEWRTLSVVKNLFRWRDPLDRSHPKHSAAGIACHHQNDLQQTHRPDHIGMARYWRCIRHVLLFKSSVCILIFQSLHLAEHGGIPDATFAHHLLNEGLLIPIRHIIPVLEHHLLTDAGSQEFEVYQIVWLHRNFFDHTAENIQLLKPIVADGITLWRWSIGVSWNVTVNKLIWLRI